MSSKAKTLARTLLRENRKNKRSWRVQAREDYGGKVNHATLNRIARTKGEWLPKDPNILIALGLKQPRKTKEIKPTPISEMATAQLRAALRNRREMPPVDPRIIKQFEKLGWLKREKRTRTR